MLNADILIKTLSVAKNHWAVECIESIDSTNLELSRRFGHKETSPFLLLAAETQTSGRGRHQRKWLSVPGADITASVIFPSPVAPIDIPKLSICAGIALINALDKLYSLKPSLRWPNDIVTTKGKLSGILSTYLSVPDAVICGIGINVNSTINAFNHGDTRPRTSIFEELGHTVERESVICEWIFEFEKAWHLAESSFFSTLKASFDKVNIYQDRRIRIFPDGQSCRDYTDPSDAIIGIGGSIKTDGSMIAHLNNDRIYVVSTDDLVEMA